MNLKDIRLFGLVILGGLAVGWMMPGESADAPQPQAAGAVPETDESGGGGVFGSDSASASRGAGRTVTSGRYVPPEDGRSDPINWVRPPDRYPVIPGQDMGQASAAPATVAPAAAPASSPASASWGSAPGGNSGWGVQAGVPSASSRPNPETAAAQAPAR